jgi:acylphosphatase
MSEETSADKLVCVRCVVAGRVQGVFFRSATREQALRLGVGGYARNLPDGHVEVLACGSYQAVSQIREWLREGPPMAEVTGIACEPVEYRSTRDFATD